jgi:hypothetical protein
MRRPLYGLLVLASSLALGCSSDDPAVERRGGPLPPDDTPAGAAGQGSAGSPISFCEALSVIVAKCQRCHQDPPQHGAPAPFLTYEDLRAPYGNTGRTYADVMGDLVEKDLMPYVALNEPPVSLMPPVEPLTVEEKATLLGWLEQGAKPEGGTDCR